MKFISGWGGGKSNLTGHAPISDLCHLLNQIDLFSNRDLKDLKYLKNLEDLEDLEDLDLNL